MSDRYIFPNGIYQLEVMESSAGTNVNGKDFLSLKCKVVAAKKVDSDEEVKIGYQASVSMYLTDKAMEYTERFLRHVGFYNKAESLAQISPDHPGFISLEGIRFDASNTPKNGYDSWFPMLPKTGSGTAQPPQKKASLARLAALDNLYKLAKKPADTPMPPPTGAAVPVDDYLAGW